MIILTSHGKYCEGALDTLNMICGSTGFTSLVFDGENIDEYERKLINIVNECNSPIIICTDILGGTPYNTSVKNYGSDKEITIISGFNIPLLIGLKFSNKQDEIEKIINEQTITQYKLTEYIDDEIEL